MFGALPDECVASRALGAVIQHVLQREGKGEPLRVRDVQVRDVVVVVHAHEHLILRGVCYVILLQNRGGGGGLEGVMSRGRTCRSRPASTI